jgi:mRNA interferase RelE/StbE
MPYEVSVAQSARKTLDRLVEALRNRIVRRIEGLATNPRPPGCRKLVGAEAYR